MSRTWDEGDDWDDDSQGDFVDDEGPYDDASDEATEPCPYCGREIHEDSQRCPYCENFISAEDRRTGNRKPWWLIVAAGVGLGIVLWWIMH